MTTFKWLNEATKKIHFGPDREAVRRELEEHLLDRQERYLARGMAEDEAAKAAVADMGDPETLAVELGRIHSPWWGWLWQASRALLALAAAVFLMTYLITQTGFGDWPGQRLYEYITWEGSSHFTGEALLERRQYAPERTGKAGAYTLKAEGITLDTVVKAAPFRVLYIDMTITRPLWAQPCAFSDAIHTVSDSTGAVYSSTFASGSPHFSYRDSRESALGQKFRLMLWYVPEDVQWVELGFGYGDLARTMRLELKEGEP